MVSNVIAISSVNGVTVPTVIPDTPDESSAVSNTCKTLLGSGVDWFANNEDAPLRFAILIVVLIFGWVYNKTIR